MKIELTEDEINLLLSSIGLSINMLQNEEAARKALELLQTKLMAVRDAG